jgi:hypothetical protein
MTKTEGSRADTSGSAVLRRSDQNGSAKRPGRFRVPVGRLHRYLGGLVAGLVLVLAATGVLLNHPGLLGAPSERALSFAADPLDPEHLLRGTRSGLYRSVDGGKTWSEVPMLFPAEKAVDISFMPERPEVIYVVLQDLGLIRSTEGGIVWEGLPLGFSPLAEGIRLEQLGVSGDGTLALWTSAGLFAGDERGEAWRRVGDQPTQGPDYYTIVHQIHTGYFFSHWFLYLYDATSVVMAILVGTGILIWRPGIRRRRSGRTRPRVSG